MKYWPALFLLLFLLPACRNTPDYKDDELYHDYRITAEEGAGQVSVLVQFKKKNSFGEGIALDDESSIQLDDKPLVLNKQKLTDPIYVAAPSLTGFEGSHTFCFTDRSGKKWKQEIVFPVFRLPEGPLFQIPSDGSSYLITVLADSSLHGLRVMMIDTSYAGKEFNKVLPLENSQLSIRPADLNGLRPGPIQLELIAENQHRLGGKGQVRGTISASFTIRREFDWYGPVSLARRR